MIDNWGTIILIVVLAVGIWFMMQKQRKGTEEVVEEDYNKEENEDVEAEEELESEDEDEDEKKEAGKDMDVE